MNTKTLVLLISAFSFYSSTSQAGRVPISAADAGCGSYSQGCGVFSSCSWSSSGAYVDVSGITVDNQAQFSYLQNDNTDGPNCSGSPGGKYTVSDTVSHTVGYTWELNASVGGKAGFKVGPVQAEINATVGGKYGGNSATTITFGTSKEAQTPACSNSHTYLRTKVKWGEKAHLTVTIYCTYTLDSDCGFGSCKKGTSATVTGDSGDVKITNDFNVNTSNSNTISWAADCPDCPCKTVGATEPSAPTWWTQAF